MRKKLVIVSHTHWDREWYLTFQHTRLKLIRLMDGLLGLLSRDPDYLHFMCDGQTIMLEDYVEVRPERKEELMRRIQEGRLTVGPWYVLADEFLPGGESHIRNLLLGRRQTRSFGAEPHGVGYLPDAFGHMAQMPQVLRGFGMDSAVLWRGVPGEVGTTEFLWQGTDGGELLTIHLPFGYSNAQMLPLQEEALLARIAMIRGQLESRATTDYMLLMNGNDHVEPQPELARIIGVANERLRDAELLHGTLPEYVAGLRASMNGGRDVLPRVSGELRSVDGAHLLQGVLSTRMWVKQENRRCETLLNRWSEPFAAIADMLREGGGRRELSHNGGNARYLPADPQPMLWLAWKYLLQNQAHDSICGCGVDEVYEDVRARFNWSLQIGEELAQQALATIAAHIRIEDLKKVARHEVSPEEERSRLAFVVFNAEGGPRTDFATLRTKAPVDASDLILADGEGNPQPYQILAQHRSELMSTDISRSDLETFLNMVSGGDITSWSKEKIDALESMFSLMLADKFPSLVIAEVEIRPSLIPDTVIVEISTAEQGKHNYPSIADSLHEVAMLVMRGNVSYFQLRVSLRDDMEIAFVARDVPAYGYRTYQLLPGHRTRRESRLPGSENAIHNEYFFVQASPADGTLTVIDRETGAVYERLNQFVDGGDAGDEYNYSPPAEDRLVESPAAPPVITLVENGPVRSTLRIDTVLMLPRSLVSSRGERSGELVECAISTFVSLCSGVRRIDIRSEVDNRAEDHRLRVHFTTKIVADHAMADHSFAVLERPVAPSRAASNGPEQVMATYPHHTFVDISDGEVGILLANRGLPEFEAIPAQHGTTLALTLLRSVGWLSRDDLATRRGNAGPSLATVGAQCLGRHQFHYSIVPHNGGWQDASRQAYWFANPMRTVESTPGGGLLALEDSFVDLEPSSLQLTALKAAENRDGIVARFFNPGSTEQLARLKISFPVKRVEVVNLGEQRISELEDASSGVASVPVGPGEIVTLKLVT